MRPLLRERVAARYGVPRTYGSYAEMLSAGKAGRHRRPAAIHAPRVHCPGTGALRAALFIEKPLAASVPMGERIVSALHASGAADARLPQTGDHATVRRAEIERLRRTGESGAMRYVRITMPRRLGRGRLR